MEEEEVHQTDKLMLNRSIYQLDTCPVVTIFIEKSQKEYEDLQKYVKEGQKGRKNIVFKLLALTMIDRATGWVEFVIASDSTALVNAILFDKEWLCRYSRPFIVIHDNGGEFIGHEFQEMIGSYGIKYQPTTVNNPHSNALIERTHLSVGDKFRTTTFEGED